MARRESALEEVAVQIRSARGPVLIVPGDVSKEQDCRRAVAETEAGFGAVDVLVNNAGYGVLSLFEETPASEAERIIAVNLLGSFYTTAAVLPGMKARRTGHVVFVSSIVGKKGAPGYALYSASKFGQVGLADTLRAEVAKEGIAVSVIFPISTATAFRQSLVRPGGTAVESASLGFVQSADHVARSIVKCLERPSAEVYPYPLLRWLLAANQIFPGLGTRVVASMARSSRRRRC